VVANQRFIGGPCESPMNDQINAYDAVGWDRLSPYAKSCIEQIAARDGITLHHQTDEATLRRLIRIYRTGW
jgi:hypothetical protein